jgi:hypothetical protein
MGGPVEGENKVTKKQAEIKAVCTRRNLRRLNFINKLFLGSSKG